MMACYRRRLRPVLVLCLAALLTTVTGGAWAANGDIGEAQIRVWENRLEVVAKRVESGYFGSLEARDLRADVEAVAAEASKAREQAAGQAKQSKALIDSLGPPPIEGEAEESDAVRAKRKELAGELAAYEGWAKQAGLIVTRAEQVLGDIGRQSRERLKAKLLERLVVPLDLRTWAVAVPEFLRLLTASFAEAPLNWWGSVVKADQRAANLAWLVAFAAAVAAGVWPVRRWLRRRFGRVADETEPTFSRRLLAALVEGIAQGLMPIVFVLTIRFLALTTGVVEGNLFAVVTEAVTRTLVLFLLGYALINATFAPESEKWSLTGFDAAASRDFAARLKVVLTVFFVFDGLWRCFSWATPSAELDSVFTLVFTTILAPLLMALVTARVWRRPEAEAVPAGGGEEAEAAAAEGGAPEEPVTPGMLRPLVRVRWRLAGMALLAVSPVAAAAGYAPFASYLTGAVMLSGIALSTLWFLRTTVHEGIASLLDPNHDLSRTVRTTLALDAETSDRLSFWITGVVDLVLMLIAVVVLLPVWGLGPEETAVWVAKVFRGIQIGTHTFSPLDLLVGIGLFVAVIVVTRLIQQAMSERVLPRLTRDKGVRDALRTGIGYLGFVTASLVAVSALGLDLTNLALIAGALSVGIGFGLQNVVNNFVSGLILLVERPIKPGDWVVIGGHEGTVKKVNVRSTEIETFQRASVIIPNADLIANSVVNWTHKNLSGRVDIAVGVAYGTDVRLVERLLLECVNVHPNVVAKPPPFVLFMGFGDSALDFEVRAYLSNVEKRLRTASDLRHAIYEAFARHGVEIPFPQRVVHMPLPPPLSGALPAGDGDGA